MNESSQRFLPVAAWGQGFEDLRTSRSVQGAKNESRQEPLLPYVASIFGFIKGIEWLKKKLHCVMGNMSFIFRTIPSIVGDMGKNGDNL